MKLQVIELKRMIQEAMGALKMLNTLKSQVVIAGSSHDIKVEEVITDIRVIKGVATVVQNGAIHRTTTGRRIMNLIITFDTKKLEKQDYIERLGKTMKMIKGVDTVVFDSLNDRPLKDDENKKPVY